MAEAALIWKLWYFLGISSTGISYLSLRGIKILDIQFGDMPIEMKYTFYGFSILFLAISSIRGIQKILHEGENLRRKKMENDEREMQLFAKYGNKINHKH